MFILKKGHQPGVYVPLRALFLVFLFLLLNIDCGYSLRRFLRVSTIYVLSKNKKIIFFYLKIFIFTGVKNSCILHGHVFVMFYPLIINTCSTIYCHVLRGKIIFLDQHLFYAVNSQEGLFVLDY